MKYEIPQTVKYTFISRLYANYGLDDIINSLYKNYGLVAGLYAIYGLDDIINSMYKNSGLGSRFVCDWWTGCRHIMYRRAYTNTV